MAKKKKTDPTKTMIAQNRKAYHNYFVEEAFEAGIMLTGTEVKSLRSGKANIAESYAADEEGALHLVNAYIPEYNHGNRNNHAPRRSRKLLLHRRQINKLLGSVQKDGLTIIPLKLYFNPRGIAKVEIALCRGKKNHDKRQTSKDRDWKRQQSRLMREKG